MKDYEIRFVDRENIYIGVNGIQRGRHQVFVDGKRIKMEYDKTLHFDHNVTFEEELRIRIETQLLKMKIK